MSDQALLGTGACLWAQLPAPSLSGSSPSCAVGRGLACHTTPEHLYLADEQRPIPQELSSGQAFRKEENTRLNQS